MANLHESALTILVPEADSVVGPCRSLNDPSASVGVPAHVTVLYPFKPPETLTEEDLAQLNGLFAAFPAFDFSLTELRRFPDVLYLEPEPAAPFKALTGQVAALFPETPPYGGVYTEVVPHLTLAQVTDPALLDEIEAEFRKRCGRELPIRSTARQVVLMDNVEGLWQVRVPFRLGAATPSAVSSELPAGH